MNRLQHLLRNRLANPIAFKAGSKLSVTNTFLNNGHFILVVCRTVELLRRSCRRNSLSPFLCKILSIHEHSCQLSVCLHTSVGLPVTEITRQNAGIIAYWICAIIRLKTLRKLPGVQSQAADLVANLTCDVPLPHY